MTGDEGDGAGDVAVGDGNARVGGCRDAGGDAGHDLERDAAGAERLGLLTAATEHERVAALEAHDGLALPCPRDELVGDVLLSHRPARLLAHVHELGILAGAVERTRGDEAVVEDGVGVRDELDRPHGQQRGVAGPAPTR